MSYRSRRNTRDAFIVIAVVAAIVMYSQNVPLSVILNIAVVALVLPGLLYPLFRLMPKADQIIGHPLRKRRLKHIARSNRSLDVMTWEEFEYFVADWLRHRGYTGVRVTEKYDLGVDIVAKKNGVTWGVQVKHYRSLVGIEAVRQVVVALKKYKCDRAMVITNSVFSRPAIELAKSQDCILIGGSRL